MGIAGVLASCVTVMLYQGVLTFLFIVFGSGLPDYVINEIRSAGGVLIVGIGFSSARYLRNKIMQSAPRHVLRRIVCLGEA